MTSEITYSDKIGLMLLNLKSDEVFIISEKVAPENKNKFLNIVKSYIDRNFGNNESWQILFNNSYTKIRKDKYIP